MAVNVCFSAVDTVPKQSRKELKTKTATCLSASSDGAKFWVYILLFRATSCDKDGHGSPEDWANDSDCAGDRNPRETLDIISRGGGEWGWGVEDGLTCFLFRSLIWTHNVRCPSSFSVAFPAVFTAAFIFQVLQRRELAGHSVKPMWVSLRRGVSLDRSMWQQDASC